MENRLRLMLSASVIALRNKPFGLLQKPRVVNTIRKPQATMIHL
jgi:hypothetical protein